MERSQVRGSHATLNQVLGWQCGAVAEVEGSGIYGGFVTAFLAKWHRVAESGPSEGLGAGYVDICW